MLNTYINSQVIKIVVMVIKKINGGHQKIKERINSQGRPFSRTEVHVFKA